jgi:hypothetical protein
LIPYFNLKMWSEEVPRPRRKRENSINSHLCDVDWHQLARSCKLGTEPSGFIKCGTLLDQLSYYQLLKNCVPWS